MTVAFILGAGFSRGYNPKLLPLISDFLNIAEKNGILKPDGEHKELVEFIQKYFGKEYQCVNIETLATFLTTDLVPDVSQKYEFREKLYKQLYSIIIRTLSFPYGKPQDQPTHEIYQNFAHKLAKNGSHVITFNYDLILDNLLLNTKNWSQLDGYGINMRMIVEELAEEIRRQQKNKSKLKYLKLHGSLNWGRSIIPHPYQGDEILLGVSGIVPDQTILPLEGSSLAYDMVNMFYQSFIIPPILTKQDLYNIPLLQNIWYKAKWVINGADEIYVIGCSFPPSDFTAEFLFRQALTFPPQKSPKKINIVNIKINDELIDRIKNVFQKCEINPIELDVVSFLETYT